jgi:predicted amidohydrolase
VPANWPQPRHEHWRALLRARAIENQAYVVGVNRVGVVEDLPHAGGSAVIDPLGVTLAEGSADEAVMTADIDAATVRQIRSRFPFLADRR